MNHCCHLNCLTIDPTHDQVDGRACDLCGSFSYCRCKCRSYVRSLSTLYLLKYDLYRYTIVYNHKNYKNLRVGFSSIKADTVQPDDDEGPTYFEWITMKPFNKMYYMEDLIVLSTKIPDIFYARIDGSHVFNIIDNNLSEKEAVQIFKNFYKRIDMEL